MSTLLSDAATVELTGREPWPKDTKLFQPYEVGQILLPDFASCMSVKAFLNMCNLPFQVELRSNAEYMSPSGKLPFLQIGRMLVSELDPIITHVSAKGTSLSADLSATQRAEMRAHMGMVENILVNSELYLTWLDKDNEKLSRERYGSAYTWPLNVILPIKKKYEVQQIMKALNWNTKTTEDVCDDIQTCCQALSQKLGDQLFFFGKEPTELDALVYGHLYTLLTTSMPVARVAEIVDSFDNLASFCRRIDRVYFQETELGKDEPDPVQ